MPKRICLITTPIFLASVLTANAASPPLSYAVLDHFSSAGGNKGMPYITITAAGPFGTPDGSGAIVGHVKNISLKLAREYDNQGNQFTHIYLSYSFNNSPGTESDRGMDPDQRLNINLLDGNRNYVVEGLVVGGSRVPRDHCHGGPAYGGDLSVSSNDTLPFDYQWKSNFDFVGKDVQFMEITVTGFGGYQGPC